MTLDDWPALFLLGPLLWTLARILAGRPVLPRGGAPRRRLGAVTGPGPNDHFQGPS